MTTPTVEEIIDSFSIHRPKGQAKGTLARRTLKKKLNTAINQKILEARIEGLIEGLIEAKSIVIRRTEIPADAKNPKRDLIVLVGEACAETLDHHIKQLTTELNKEGGSDG